MKRSEPELRQLGTEIDELTYLKDASKFLSKELDCEMAIYRADDGQAPDPQKKARAAQPHRPAIYVE